MTRQSRRVDPNGRETREVIGANRVALGTMQARNTRNREGEPMADKEGGNTGEMEVAEVERDVTMSETTAEIKMGAATSNDYSNPAQLGQVLCVDHGSAGDRSGLKGCFSTVAGAARGKRENRNQSPGL